MRDNKRSAVIADIVAVATVILQQRQQYQKQQLYISLPLDGITQERGKIKMDEKEKSVIAEDDNTDQTPENNTSVENDQRLSNESLTQQEVETAPDTPSNDEASEPTPELSNESPETPQPVEQTFTQSRVNELVGRARQEGRESALKELFNRYGVNSDEEMNEVFGRGQAYDGLNDEYSAVQSSYNDLRTENALLRSEVAPERYEDVKLILGGKGMDVTVENIAMMLPSHPEWKGSAVGSEAPNSTTIAPQPGTPNGAPAPAQPAAQIRQLSTDATPEPVESDEDKAMKLYGL